MCMFNNHSILFKINLSNKIKCVSLLPDLLYIIFHNILPDSKSLPELNIAYSVFVCIIR